MRWCIFLIVFKCLLCQLIFQYCSFLSYFIFIYFWWVEQICAVCSMRTIYKSHFQSLVDDMHCLHCKREYLIDKLFQISELDGVQCIMSLMFFFLFNISNLIKEAKLTNNIVFQRKEKASSWRSKNCTSQTEHKLCWSLCRDQSIVSVLFIYNPNDNFFHFLIRKHSALIDWVVSTTFSWNF